MCDCYDTQVVWSFTRLVMSEFASDEMRRIASRMLCNMSSIPAARAVLIEQRTVPAIDNIVKAVGMAEHASFVRRCCAIVCRNLSYDCANPLKVGGGTVVLRLCGLVHVSSLFSGL